MKKKTLSILVGVGASLTTLAVAASAQTDWTNGRSNGVRQFSSAGGAAGSYQTGFDSGEGFVPGWVGGQNGWITFGTSMILARIDTANPAAGDQHLRIAFEPTLPQGSAVGAFSPNQGVLPPVRSTISVDISLSSISQFFGADYDVVPQAPSQELKSAHVKFNFQGLIWVLDDLGGGLQFVNTGVPWNAGVYTNLTIDIDPAANTIDYFYGGNLIYSSVAGVFLSTTTEQVVLFSNNRQLNVFETADFDNLSVTLGCLGNADCTDDGDPCNGDELCVDGSCTSVPAIDCNDNGVLDSCDIASGTSPDLNGNGVPDECDSECPLDLNGDGSVNVPDLLTLLANWGLDPGGPPDFNGDGAVNVPDLLALLAGWGPCS